MSQSVYNIISNSSEIGKDFETKGLHHPKYLGNTNI